MAFPPYVPTRVVSIGGAATIASGRPLRLRVTVSSSRSLVWAATGYRFEALAEQIVGDAGSEVTVNLPRTDVPGWRDARTGAVIDVSAPDSLTHTYRLLVEFLDDDRVAGVDPLHIGPFVLPAGDGALDVSDTVPVGTTTGQALAVPDVWSKMVADAEQAAADAAATLAQLGAPEVDPLPETVAKRDLGGAVAVGAPTAAEHAVPVGELVPLGSAARAALDTLRIAPTLTPITERLEPLLNPLIQVGSRTVYAAWSRTGEIPQWRKTTDGGGTWTTLSTMPGVPMAAVRLASGTILAVQEASTTTPGGSNPKVWRSTDDGGTWSEVAAGLKFPPLSTQGICEAPDGSVMIGEYGNVGSFQYRIVRSTDDGVTWSAVLTTAGTEPQGDPGHFHSVTLDPVAGKLVAFSDRPIVAGVSGPRIYVSDDDGATWDVLGESDTPDRPNFVSPMYFPEYIAWGSDNQINGRISRIRRDDFYAGNFDAVEPVAQLSQKALYFTFPLRPDVWVVAMATEHINSDEQDGTPGSYAIEVWVVSDNGSLVTPGVEAYKADVTVGVLSGVRAQFPSRLVGELDHDGIVWARLPVGRPRPYAAVPLSQGVEPAGTKRVQPRALPYLPPAVPFPIARDDGTESFFLTRTTSGSIQMEETQAATGRGALRFDADGTVAFLLGGSVVASLAPGAGGFRMPNGVVELTTTGVGLKIVATNPEGSVTARVGTICLAYNGGRGTSVWVKETGTGNTGWAPIGHPSGTTAQRPASPPVGLSYFDTTIGKPVWSTGSGWVDATGETA